MDLQLAGDVALVVGGAQGIGWAIAQEFAAEGARVVVFDRDPKVMLRPAELPGGAALARQVDVTDYIALSAAIDEVFSLCGRLDHGVYAAGAGSGKFGFPFWKLSPSDWGRVLDVNLLGAVHFAHALGPRLADARRGTLLFLSSIAGQIGSQTDPPYSAAKAALINFAQCAARDLAEFQVRVNTLCPGMVQTALNRGVWEAWFAEQPPSAQRSYEDWAGEKVRRVSPLGRWQEPRDIAALAVFLASPRAANITGQTMNVDGGQVMHW